jgi:hypothetical protein
MMYLLHPVCPPCGQRVPTHYEPAQAPAHGDRPEPAFWDWAVWHDCTHTDAQLDAIEAELESLAPRACALTLALPLGDLPL